jgi:hypothetical protein
MADEDLNREPGLGPEINVDGLNILRAMCARHSRRDGDRIVIDLEEAEKAALGEFLIQAVFGFILALEQPAHSGALPVRQASASPAERVAA